MRLRPKRLTAWHLARIFGLAGYGVWTMHPLAGLDEQACATMALMMFGAFAVAWGIDLGIYTRRYWFTTETAPGSPGEV